MVVASSGIFIALKLLALKLHFAVWGEGAKDVRLLLWNKTLCDV